MIYGQFFCFQEVFFRWPLPNLARPKIDNIPGQRKKQSLSQPVGSFQDFIF